MRGMLGDYLRAVQLKQQHEQFQQQHDLAQKQLDELHAYHQGELDRQQKELEFNKATTAQTLKNHLIQQIASGVQQPPENAQPTGVNVQYGTDQNSNLPQSLNSVLPQAQGISSTGSQFQLSPEDLGGLASSLSPAERTLNVASPERMAQLGASAAGQKAGAVAGAQVAAEAPEKEAERTSRENIAQRQTDERLAAAELAANQRTKTAEETNATRKYTADTNAAARRYAADVNANNKSKINDAELGDAANNVALGLSDLPPGVNGIHVQSILKQQGQVPFGKKTGGDKIDGLNDLDGIFQDMSDASKQLGTGLGGQIVGGIKQHLPITTDLKNKINAIDARSPEVVRNVFGIGSGRITNTEINKATQALLSGTMTQEQAQENINKLRRDTYTKVYSDILGPLSTQQKIAVLSQHGGLDRWRGVEINYKGQNIPVIRKMSNGREAMFNANTGQYEGIEDLK